MQRQQCNKSGKPGAPGGGKRQRWIIQQRLPAANAAAAMANAAAAAAMAAAA